MNKIIRQTCVVGLFVLAVTIGVSAQSDQQYRADVPFSFEVGGKQYEAGKYMVGPASRTATGAIAIRNIKTGEGRLLGLSDVGNNDWDNPGTLTFLKIAGRYRLSHISTATFKMKMKSKTRDNGLLAGSGSPDVVAVKLK